MVNNEILFVQDFHQTLDSFLSKGDSDIKSYEFNASLFILEMYNIRKRLAASYHKIPRDEAQTCKERLDIFYDMVCDYLNIELERDIKKEYLESSSESETSTEK